MEDGFQDLLQPLQVLSNAFWLGQHISYILRLYQYDLNKKSQYSCYYISW